MRNYSSITDEGSVDRGSGEGAKDDDTRRSLAYQTNTTREDTESAGNSPVIALRKMIPVRNHIGTVFTADSSGKARAMNSPRLSEKSDSEEGAIAR